MAPGVLAERVLRGQVVHPSAPGRLAHTSTKTLPALSPHSSQEHCAGGHEQDRPAARSPVCRSRKYSDSFQNLEIPPNVKPKSPELQVQPVSSSVSVGDGRLNARPHISGWGHSSSPASPPPCGAGTPGLGWAPTSNKALLLGLGRAAEEPKAELWGFSASPSSQTQD